MCFNEDMKKDNINVASRIIDSLGGTRAVANRYDKKDSTVSMWKVNGIPDVWMLVFERDFPDLIKRIKKS